MLPADLPPEEESPNEHRHDRRTRIDTGSQSPVGRYFHATRICPHGARVAQWQGQVLAGVADDVLQIELCEWITGSPSGQELITLADFMAKNPVLYSDAEWMNSSYKQRELRHHRTAIDTDAEEQATP
jgi:hypothetical protein